jgi:opacity protein-like surface antigen
MDSRSRSHAFLASKSMLAILLLASSAAAQDYEEEEENFVYARPGFYLGVGGTVAWGAGWDSDIDRDLNGGVSSLANASADANFPGAIVPLNLDVDGADLEDAMLGFNGVVGYRVAERLAFEIEGEWLTDSSKTDLDITGSTGTHTAKLDEIRVLTANLRMYLPFDWRIQPSAVVGVGLHHSKLSVHIATEGLTTTNPPGTITIPADFRAKDTRSKLTGAVRLGGGVEVYATPNLVGQINASYVLPFDDVANTMTADYVSLVWRLIYRF